jgi:hypothetical protein
MGPIGKALSNVARGSLTERESSKLTRILDRRMMPSEAIEAATRIVSYYPGNMTAKSGDGYVGALSAMLSSYPKQVAQHCADPVRGIVRECKFPPSVADIVAWCEHKTEPLRIQVDRERRVAQQIEERERFEDLERNVRPERMTIAELKERYGDWSPPTRPEKEGIFNVRQISKAEIGPTPALKSLLARTSE